MMEGLVKIAIGIVVLILGIPIGNFLVKVTQDERKQGQKWFKLVVLVGVIGGVIGLILWNDVLLFTFLFIAVIASRSLGKK